MKIEINIKNYCINHLFYLQFIHTCLPDAGNHDKLETKTFKVVIFPVHSPSAPHLHTTLSSLHDKSWQSGDHETAVVISVSVGIKSIKEVYSKCEHILQFRRGLILQKSSFRPQ
jgi:hypothetical protein